MICVEESSLFTSLLRRIRFGALVLDFDEKLIFEAKLDDKIIKILY